MALFKPYHGPEELLDQIDYHDGYVYLSTDNKQMYADVPSRVPTNLPEQPDTPVTDLDAAGYTWEDVNNITLAGKARDYFALGAVKNLNYSGDEYFIAGTTGTHFAAIVPAVLIGFNQDGDNTTTFLADIVDGDDWDWDAFGRDVSSLNIKAEAEWPESYARAKCQAWYEGSDVKPYVKVVRKGYCYYSDDDKANGVRLGSGGVIYEDETFWLLSELERGLDKYSTMLNSLATTTNGECTYGYNEPYEYFVTPYPQIKGKGYELTDFFLRSRHYYSSDFVCIVTSGGSANINNYNNSIGLAPAFTLGNTDASTIEWDENEESRLSLNADKAKVANALLDGEEKVTVGQLIKKSEGITIDFDDETGLRELSRRQILIGGDSAASATQLWASRAGALYYTKADGLPQVNTLPITVGGTGATTAEAARTNLAVYSKTEVDSLIGSATSKMFTTTLTTSGWTLSNDGAEYIYTYSNTELTCGAEGDIPPMITYSSNQEEYSKITSAEATAGTGIEFRIPEKPSADIGLIIIDIR